MRGEAVPGRRRAASGRSRRTHVSRRANPTVVGAFVPGAAALSVAGVALFGSGAFLKRQVEAVAIFRGGREGLDVGTPVTILAVRAGAVSKVQLDIDSTTLKPTVYAYLTLEPDVIRFSGPENKRSASGER